MAGDKKLTKTGNQEDFMPSLATRIIEMAEKADFHVQQTPPQNNSAACKITLRQGCCHVAATVR